MFTQLTPTPQTRRPQNDVRRCSFCGKSEQQVEHMISSKHSVHICNECVALCGEIVAEHRAQDRGN